MMLLKYNNLNNRSKVFYNIFKCKCFLLHNDLLFKDTKDSYFFGPKPQQTFWQSELAHYVPWMNLAFTLLNVSYHIMKT